MLACPWAEPVRIGVPGEFDQVHVRRLRRHLGDSPFLLEHGHSAVPTRATGIAGTRQRQIVTPRPYFNPVTTYAFDNVCI